MIESFGDKMTEDIASGRNTARSRRLPADVKRRAIVRLTILNAATDLNDLRTPPGNRLESLSGDLSGFHSIRINNQWRVIFRWQADGPHDVQVVDYH